MSRRSCSSGNQENFLLLCLLLLFFLIFFVKTGSFTSFVTQNLKKTALIKKHTHARAHTHKDTTDSIMFHSYFYTAWAWAGSVEEDIIWKRTGPDKGASRQVRKYYLYLSYWHCLNKIWSVIKAIEESNQHFPHLKKKKQHFFEIILDTVIRW